MNTHLPKGRNFRLPTHLHTVTLLHLAGIETMNGLKTFLAMAWVFTCALSWGQPGGTQKIKDRQLKFSFDLPAGMVKVPDTLGGGMFYDSTADLVLLITETESPFKSVHEYIDCNQMELEYNLRKSYADSSLQLLSCTHSPYYSKKTTVITMALGVLSSGYDRCTVYFIHHRRKDVQFSFMFKKPGVALAMKKIDEVMGSLRLE